MVYVLNAESLQMVPAFAAQYVVNSADTDAVCYCPSAAVCGGLRRVGAQGQDSGGSQLRILRLFSPWHHVLSPGIAGVLRLSAQETMGRVTTQFIVASRTVVAHFQAWGNRPVRQYPRITVCPVLFAIDLKPPVAVVEAVPNPQPTGTQSPGTVYFRPEEICNGIGPLTVVLNEAGRLSAYMASVAGGLAGQWGALSATTLAQAGRIRQGWQGLRVGRIVPNNVTTWLTRDITTAADRVCRNRSQAATTALAQLGGIGYHRGTGPFNEGWSRAWVLVTPQAHLCASIIPLSPGLCRMEAQ